MSGRNRKETCSVSILAKSDDPGTLRMKAMERVARHFGSFEAAEAADIEEDVAMTPEQRVAMVLELQARFYPDASQQRLARVYRITQLQRG
jgi:hypothetical protein